MELVSYQPLDDFPAKSLALPLRGVEDKYENDIVLKKELAFFRMQVPCTYLEKGGFADVERRLGISTW